MVREELENASNSGMYFESCQRFCDTYVRQVPAEYGDRLLSDLLAVWGALHVFELEFESIEDLGPLRDMCLDVVKVFSLYWVENARIASTLGIDLDSPKLGGLQPESNAKKHAEDKVHISNPESGNERVMEVIEMIDRLPVDLQPHITEIVDRWVIWANTRSFWNRGVGEVFDDILYDARKFSMQYEVNPDNATLFALFNIVTASLAKVDRDPRDTEDFTYFRLREVFVFLLLALLNPFISVSYVLGNGGTNDSAVGMAVVQLIFVIAIALLYGSLRLSGLVTRKNLSAWALVIFAVCMAFLATFGKS